MDFKIYQHRHAHTILNDSEFIYTWSEIKQALHSITEEEIISEFLSRGEKRGKSISKSINSIKVGLVKVQSLKTPIIKMILGASISLKILFLLKLDLIMVALLRGIY